MTADVALAAGGRWRSQPTSRQRRHTAKCWPRGSAAGLCNLLRNLAFFSRQSARLRRTLGPILRRGIYTSAAIVQYRCCHSTREVRSLAAIETLARLELPRQRSSNCSKANRILAANTIANQITTPDTYGTRPARACRLVSMLSSDAKSAFRSSWLSVAAPLPAAAAAACAVVATCSELIIDRRVST